MDRTEFLAYLHEQIAVYGSQKALARHCGVGDSYMSEVMRGTREPGPKLCRALGFKKVVRYVQIEEDDV